MSYKFDITDTEFRMIRDYIYDRFGLFFRDGKRSFVRMKLYTRVISLGMTSFGEYFHHIRYKDPKENK